MDGVAHRFTLDILSKLLDEGQSLLRRIVNKDGRAVTELPTWEGVADAYLKRFYPTFGGLGIYIPPPKARRTNFEMTPRNCDYDECAARCEEHLDIIRTAVRLLSGKDV